MAAADDMTPDADTIGDVFAVATRSAGRSGDLAMAAGQVFARRVALGVVAAMDPLRADHAEFGRMVPEKLKAFTAAGMIMVTQSGEAGRHIAQLASDAVMTATTATLAMVACGSPLALLEAQNKVAIGWLDRVASHCITMGMLAAGAHEAAMAPIRQAVAANAERLRG